MKKEIILGSLLALALTSTAQQWNGPNVPNQNIDRYGNVSILQNSNTQNPQNEIEIETVTPQNGIQITQNNITPLKRGAAAIHLKTISTGVKWSIYSLGLDNNNWGPGNFVINDDLSSEEAPKFTIRHSEAYPTQPYATQSKGFVGLSNAFPEFKLDINTSVPSDGIRIRQTGYGSCALYLDNTLTGGSNWAFHSLGQGHPAGNGNFAIYEHNPGANQSSSGYRLFIEKVTGRVGIGTINPLAKLAVDGAASDAVVAYISNPAARAFVCRDYNAVETFQVLGDGCVGISSTATAPTDHAFVIVDYSQNTKNFVILKNGTTYAREIFVNLGVFPDYVFKNDYKLMPLHNLEAFIKENHHLPNVPSAAEVDKNGAGLGELAKIQMEKIEELTLYILELNKENKALRKDVNKLLNKIDSK